MSGKQKSAQRTKNNTRPSNSGRSAELLSSIYPQVSGFNTIKDGGLVGLSRPVDDLELVPDVSFQLVFKKMMKKDSTTKLKAFEKFIRLVEAADVDLIKTVLPYWPRLYCILANDKDNKVRKACQVAHHQIALKVKRNLAPFLKQIAGTWFTSQYDTYPPAASAATKSFQDLFPNNKMQEAIVFCQEEILCYICSNLTVQKVSPNNMSNVSPEEEEMRYQHAIISSLDSYAFYLKQVPTDQIEKYLDLNFEIFSKAKSLNLNKSQVQAFRLSWLKVLISVCQNTTILKEQESSYIVTLVFGHFNDKELMELPVVWEAILSAISKLHEWWNNVNLEKAALPRLYKILQEGGYNGARVIFTNLLPFISHLPNAMDLRNFYPVLFERIRMGIENRCKLECRYDYQTVSAAFFECFQYAIMKNQSDIALCEKLIKTQLFKLLEWSFNDARACYKVIYNQVTKMIQFWDRNYNEYEKYFQYFWQNLTSLFLGLSVNLAQDSEFTPTQLATRQIELVSSLKHHTKNKGQLKVSFEKEQIQGHQEIVIVAFSESYINSLNHLVYKTSEAYVNIINEKQSQELIEHLVCLLNNFSSDGFYQIYSSENDHKFGDLYKDVLLKWLNNSTLHTKGIVDLIFLVFKYLNNQEKQQILNYFCHINQEECLAWCIAQTLSHPHCEDPVVMNWLCNDTVSHFLVSLATQLVSNTINSEKSMILKQAFTEKSDEDLLISKSAVTDITNVLRSSLLDSSAIAFDACASLLAYISSIIYTSHFKLTYGDDVLVALVTLSNTDYTNDILSKDTLWELDTSWQDVITILVQEITFQDFLEIAKKCAGAIIKKLRNQSVDLISNFIAIVATSRPLWLKDTLVIFFKHDYVDNWRDDFHIVCTHAQYLRGYIRLDDPGAHESVSFKEEDIEKYLEWMNLIVNVLVKQADHLVEVLLYNGQDLLIDLFAALTLSEIYLQSYPCIKTFEDVNETSKQFQSKLQGFLCNFDADNIKAIETLLLNKLYSGGWLWTKCLYAFYIHCGDNNLSDIYTDIVNKTANTTNRPALLGVTQTWAKHITYDQIWENLTLLEACFVLRCVIDKPDLEIQVADVIGLIKRFKAANSGHLQYNSDMPTDKCELIIEIVRLFSGILTHKSEWVSIAYWDLMLTSFVPWFEDIAKKISNELQTKVFLQALCGLYFSMLNYMKKSENESILNEWNELFCQDFSKNFLIIWCFYVDNYLPKERSFIIDLPLLQDIGRVVDTLNISFIFTTDSYLYKWDKLLTRCCSLLIHWSATLQLWGYTMLKKMVPGLIEIDTNIVTNNTRNGCCLTLTKMPLPKFQEVVTAMLLEFGLCIDSCRIQPYTDSYTFTYGYLLLWDIIISFCEMATTELRFQYVEWIKKDQYLHCMMSNLFKLMPLEVDPMNKLCSDWFSVKYILCMTDVSSSQLIESIACWTYTYTLLQLPALVRQWWLDQESRVSQVVEQLTTTFVSPYICNQEFALLSNHEHKLTNMTIKTYPSKGEILAVYTVDEVQMDLVITFPHNYPLNGPDIYCTKQMLGASQKQWLMQLKVLMSHQDGRILDCLLLWKKNLDKRFDGVAECYICYSIIHNGTYQIPKLSCQTCKKKFHSACLYKWFSTSNKSTCPICRNLF